MTKRQSLIHPPVIHLSTPLRGPAAVVTFVQSAGRDALSSHWAGPLAKNSELHECGMLIEECARDELDSLLRAVMWDITPENLQITTEMVGKVKGR